MSSRHRLSVNTGDFDPEAMALPKPFLQSMRILFEILDDSHSGCVKFAEIERRWGRDENSWSSSLPKGILDCLRNVTNADNELTFDRFCAGLKICLLKSESDKCAVKSQAAFLPAADATSPNLLPPPKPPRMNPDAVSSKRRDPRRHTLQNGIAASCWPSMSSSNRKRLMQLEQEKTLLKETLLTVNETQTWLNKKLHAVHDQIRVVGRSSAPLEPPSSTQQERLDMKRAQTAEVQRSLVRLVSNWASLEERNEFLFELNLETHWSSPPERLQRLQQENQRQQEQIARLEAEKMHLVRQLKRF